MFLTAIFITWLGYQFGKGQGWWGSMRSGGSSGGGRSRPSGGSRTSGPRTGGSSTGSGAVRSVGERIGRALGWRDAKRIHDRGEPPVTWGDAWREGIDAGRQRGRDRYDEGQQRKLERELQKQWLIDAKARSGDEPLAPRGLAGRWDDHVERVRTCPDCGHGNRWNDNRESCPCERDDCACGTDAAPIGRDDEDERPDLSQPLDDEQRWGPPGEADEPNDPAEKNPDSYRPQSPPDPVAVVEDLGGEWSPNFDDYASGRVDGAQVICVLCRNAPCTCSKPPAPTGDEDQTDPEETPVSAPTAPTPSMSGEIVNFDSARDVLRGISAEMQNLSDAATETAAKHRGTVAACDAAIDGLSQIDSDPDTIGDFLALREQAMQALEAAEKAQVEAAESSSYATTVIGNIDQRHGAIEEAVRASKHPAKIDAYKAS